MIAAWVGSIVSAWSDVSAGVSGMVIGVRDCVGEGVRVAGCVGSGSGLVGGAGWLAGLAFAHPTNAKTRKDAAK